jgi:hypothetical protein
MFISVIAKRAILTCTVDGNLSSSELLLECTATDQSGVLEIGNTHVFASKNNIGFARKRRACDLQLYIKRKSGLTDKSLAKLSLSDEKIGEVGFYPDYEARDLVPSRPGSLEAFVFVSDQLFETISNALQMGRKTESIQLDIEKKGTLAFGWELDGSRMTWNLDDAAKPSYVDVTRLDIRLSLF